MNDAKHYVLIFLNLSAIPEIIIDLILQVKNLKLAQPVILAISLAKKDDHKFGASLGSLTRYYSQQKNDKGDVAQGGGRLSSMHKTLDSVPNTPKLGVVVPACNPSTLGGRDRRITSLRPFSAIEKI